MEFTIRKSGDGVDLVVETTLKDNNGTGIDDGGAVVVECSVRQLFGTNQYWRGPATNSFSGATEAPLLPLLHIANGLWRVILIGGAETMIRPYEIHGMITNNPAVNTNASYTDVIPSASGGDATEAKQDEILSKQGTPVDLGSGADLSNNNVDINSKTTNLPGDPASEAAATANASGLSGQNSAIAAQNIAILSEGGAGPWTSADTDANLTKILGVDLSEGGAGQLAAAFVKFLDVSLPSKDLNDIGDLTKVAGASTIDGIAIATWFKIMLAYTTGRFKTNFPAPGDVTFYEQNDLTEIFTMHLVSGERTRLP